MATNSISARNLILLVQIIMIIFSLIPMNSQARILIQKRNSNIDSLTLFHELGFKVPASLGGAVAGGVKRLVPNGPNDTPSPDSPSKFDEKRRVPSGPNDMPSPDSPSKFDEKRRVPSGPNDMPSPDSPSKFDEKRLVPGGPNRESSPDSPSKFEEKRLVPGGPSSITSPDPPARA